MYLKKVNAVCSQTKGSISIITECADSFSLASYNLFKKKKNAFFLYPQILNIYVLKKMTQYTKPWACLHLELMIDKEVCRTSSPISVLRISKIQRQITHKEKMGCIALVWIHCVLHLISSNPFLQMLYF